MNVHKALPTAHDMRDSAAEVIVTSIVQRLNLIDTEILL